MSADLRGKITDEMLAALQARNAQRLQQAKARLGVRWLLHPSHQLQRKAA